MHPQSKAADLATSLGGSTTTGEFGAAPAGDIVIVAPGYAIVLPIVAQYGNALAGKVIADVCNPVNAAADALATPGGTSSAQEVANAVPASASMVKAFNTTFGGAAIMNSRLSFVGVMREAATSNARVVR